MANNPVLFNAVIAGASGGGQERWITSAIAADYTTFANTVEQIATFVDAAIPTIAAGATAAQAALLQSIVQGVLAGRFLNDPGINFATIANAIAALFTQLEGGLDPAGTSSLAPLSSVFFFDANKGLADGNGSIGAPFATIQEGLDALVATLPAGGITFAFAPSNTSYGPLDATALPGGNTLCLLGVGNGFPPLATIGDITNFGGTELSLIGVTTGAVTVSGGMSVRDSVVGGTVDTQSLTGEFTTFNGDVNIVFPAALTKCTINGVFNCNGVNAIDCTFNDQIVNVGSEIRLEGGLCGNITTDGTINSRNVTHSDITSTFAGGDVNLWAARFNGAPPTITLNGGGDPVVRMDSSSNYEFFITNTGVLAGAGAVVNVIGRPKFITLSINVPVLAAVSDKGFVNTALPIPLTTLEQNTPVAVMPQADIDGGGAIAEYRISVAGTLRVGFIGPTTGGAADFTVAVIG